MVPGRTQRLPCGFQLLHADEAALPQARLTGAPVPVFWLRPGVRLRHGRLDDFRAGGPPRGADGGVAVGTIWAQPGTPGVEVASELAERAGVPLFDRKALEPIVHEF